MQYFSKPGFHIRLKFNGPRPAWLHQDICPQGVLIKSSTFEMNSMSEISTSLLNQTDKSTNKMTGTLIGNHAICQSQEQCFTSMVVRDSVSFNDLKASKLCVCKRYTLCSQKKFHSLNYVLSSLTLLELCSEFFYSFKGIFSLFSSQI